MDGTQGTAPGSLDIAAAIIESPIYVDQLKLQKLLYFAQAWYLAWYDEPMFDDRIEGWPRGPAVPRVYGLYGTELHYGWHQIKTPAAGDPDVIDDKRRAALESVLSAYGSLNGDELEALTKQDPLWAKTRVGLAPDEAGNMPIPPEEMRNYYRRSGRFGPNEPQVRLSPEVRRRIRQGDKDAVFDALAEATRA